MNAPRVKICGLSKAESVTAAKDNGADFIGFIFFAASPRNIAPKHAAALSKLAPSAQSVAVVVDAGDEMLETILKDFTPSFLQLHGRETPARVSEIKKKFGIPVIKAFSVRTGDDIAASQPYENDADMLMFDAKAPQGLPGGNGLSFDWQLLANRTFSKPWFLSGGLGADNVEEAVRISGATLLDASSGLESAPGEKSPELIRAFMHKIKSIRV